MSRLAQLEKMLAADPRDAFVLYGLGQEHAKAGRVDDAVRFYDRCLEADPAYFYAYFHRATALRDAGRESEAVETLRRGVQAARAGGDGKAASEMASLLDELT